MSFFFNPAEEPQLHNRELFARPGPIPEIRIGDLTLENVPSLAARQETSSTSSKPSVTSCGPKDTTGPCERSVSASDNTTIPIVLGVVLPLGVAFIVFIILHRRHLKKLRQEDAEDKHKSLDFGLDSQRPPVPKKSKSKKIPEMSMAAAKNAIRQERGLSMDMNLTNPYILPPELHQSRESLHSLSRSTNTGDDKYRATTFIPDDGSIRAPSRPPSSARNHFDDSSSFTGSSRHRFDVDSGKALIPNAQPTSRSSPPMPSIESMPEGLHVPRKPIPPKKNSVLPPPHPSADATTTQTLSSEDQSASSAPKIPARALARGLSEKTSKSIKTSVKEVKIPTPPESFNTPSVAPVVENRSIIQEKPTLAPEPIRHGRDSQFSFIESYSENKSAAPLEQPRMAMPVPAKQDSAVIAPTHQNDQQPRPANNHEQSTVQSHQPQPAEAHDSIHSTQNRQTKQFDIDDYYTTEDAYDEYEDYVAELGYDPRRLTMGIRPLPPDDPTENPEQRANRIRSFYKEYFEEANRPNGHHMPQYQGQDYYEDYHGAQGYYDPRQYMPPRGPSADGYGRHRAFSSNDHYSSGPRAFSAASGRYGHPQHGGYGPRMPAPKKRFIPPAPQAILPTPHKLRDDSFSSFDFAPPNMAQMQRSGTPDSLRGGSRPYSPSMRAHTPLVSAFDDLAVMPSPHQLRRSGVFTALDFAPPPRFSSRAESASDAGSVRSYRSGISQAGLHNVRKGAYRLSRVPREVAGTKDEISASLRPQWDMTR